MKCIAMKFYKLTMTLCCFTFLLMNTQCDDEDEIQAPCGQTVVVDSGFFETAESDLYELIDVQIIGNCLNVSVSASGCDGNTWSLVLVDSGSVSESLPEQRDLRLVFSNEEICQAVVTQERSFDLNAIRIIGTNEIILNIDSFPEPLNYLY